MRGQEPRETRAHTPLEQFSCSWKYQINLPPIFLRGSALSGPIRRVVQLIGNLRRPEAALMTIENVAFHRRAEPGSASVVVSLPTRRENERTAERNMRLCRGRRWPLQRYHIIAWIGIAWISAPLHTPRLGVN